MRLFQYLDAFCKLFRKTPSYFVHFAAKTGDRELLQDVLEPNEKAINAIDHTGNTAMHLAIETGRIECVQTLLFFYPDLSIMNNDGETPFYYAAKHYAWEMFKLLLDAGAKLELYHPRDGKEGKDSLLVYAVRDRNTKMIGWLLEKGADVNDIDTKVWDYTLIRILQLVNIIWGFFSLGYQRGTVLFKVY
jgi:ankyrin repeat protein